MQNSNTSLHAKLDEKGYMAVQDLDFAYQKLISQISD